VSPAAGSPAAGSPAAGSPAATRLRVVSYNLHSLRDDRRALVATVRDLAPDVLLLQEAPRRLRWRPRCAALARAFGLVVAAGGQPAAGNLILTDMRVAVRRAWSRRWPVAGRPVRGVALARCEVAGAPFVAVGAHLSTAAVQRPPQARLLRQAVGGLDAPVVLGADVNDLPGSAAWQALTTGLVDAGAAAGGDGAPTFPSAHPRRRIDAIFVDARIEIDTYRVVDSPLARRASDHLPVVADLRLPAAGAGGQERAGEE
jgi:endonuclease/exonuclease/phosphatase family metal-dependent hydrolase